MVKKQDTEKTEVVSDSIKIVPEKINPLVIKFIKGVMWGEKKSLAENIFYGAMEKLGEKTGEEPFKVFKRAISNVKPTVEVKSRRVGGSTYQVPIEVRPERQGALAVRWIVSNARGRGEKTMTDRLAAEILDAANNRGNAVGEGRRRALGDCP